MQPDRRQFLRDAARLGLWPALASGLGGLGGCGQRTPRPGSGTLAPVRDATTGLPLLRLPPGFRYFTFGWAGEALVGGGGRIPGNADGMGIVAHAGSVLTLVRNHEVVDASGAFSSVGTPWDPLCGGGCVRLHVDLSAERLLDAEAALTGTLVNCAGGVTPWGSWISCEEIVVEADRRRPDAARADPALRKPHGLAFEVPGSGPAEARPILDMGLFRKEAVAIDAATGQAYLTEDRDEISGFYRYSPRIRGDLAAGGSLEMLAAEGGPDLRTGVRVGQSWRASWVPITQPMLGHTPGTRDQGGVVMQGLAGGGSRFIRLEGCLAREDGIWFTSTSGGDAGGGQVWRYDPREAALHLVHEVVDRDLMDYPDNLAEGPGAGMLICGDSKILRRQRLHWLGRDGRLLTIAENDSRIGGIDYAASEWAGCCVSPDGRWVLANIYRPGFTVAITGPWEQWLSA